MVYFELGDILRFNCRKF